MARTTTTDGHGRSPAPGRLLAWLSSEAFPADRDLLVVSARSREAPRWVVDALCRLSPDRVFQSAEQLAGALRTEPCVRLTRGGGAGDRSRGQRGSHQTATDDRRREMSDAEERAEARSGTAEERAESRSGTDEERAERIAREVARENPDPTTRREAIEQELAEEGLSDEGRELGQPND